MGEFQSLARWEYTQGKVFTLNPLDHRQYLGPQSSVQSVVSGPSRAGGAFLLGVLVKSAFHLISQKTYHLLSLPRSEPEALCSPWLGSEALKCQDLLPPRYKAFFYFLSPYSISSSCLSFHCIKAHFLICEWCFHLAFKHPGSLSHCCYRGMERDTLIIHRI